ELKVPSFNIIGAMTGGGKTNLLLHLLKHNARKFHKIYIFCPTIDLQEAYRNIVPRKFLITEPSIERIEEIIKEQERNKKQKVALVLDDCMCVIEIHKSNILDRLASSGRHFRITTFCLLQFMNNIVRRADKATQCEYSFRLTNRV